MFLIAWGAMLLHAALRKHKTAWVKQLALAGVLLAALPFLNALSGGLSIFGSIATEQSLLAGFDLSALAVGLGLLHAARKVWRHVPKASPHKAPAAEAVEESGESTTLAGLQLKTEKTSP